MQPGEPRGMKRLIVSCEYEGQVIKKLQIESILENHDYHMWITEGSNEMNLWDLGQTLTSIEKRVERDCRRSFEWDDNIDIEWLIS